MQMQSGLVKRFFHPAIWWMDRLGYRAKFFVLGIVFCAAAGLLGNALIGHLTEHIALLKKERVGNQLTRQISEVILHAQQHRGRSASVISGNLDMREALGKKAVEVDVALQVLQKNLPQDLQEKPEFKRITAYWADIHGQGLGWSVEKSFETHSEFIEFLLNFMVTTADAFNMVLDGDLSTYYLIDLSVGRIPAMLERMGKIRAYGSGVIRTGTLSVDQRFELLYLVAELRALQDQAATHLLHTQTVSLAQAARLAVTSEVLKKEGDLVASLAEEHLLRGKVTISQEDYFTLTTKSIDSVYDELFGVVHPYIDSLLQERAARAEARLHQTLLISGLLMLLLLYLATGGYFAMRRAMGQLLDATRAFTQGQLHRRAQLHTRDELALVGQGFNEMASSLEKLYADQAASHAELKLRSEGLILAGKVFQEAHEGISVTNPQGVIEDVNPMFCRMTGYSREELVGKTHYMLRSGRHNPLFYTEMWRQLGETGNWQGEIWNRSKEGLEYAQQLTITMLHDENGEVNHYVGLSSDITESKRQYEHMERLAHHDALTGLPNRALLSDRIVQALAKARRKGEIVAVVGLDLDGFKAVNDTFGHDAGDRLLIEISRRLVRSLRIEDTAARLGGDEFVLLLTGVSSLEDSERTLQRILTAICEPVQIDAERTAQVSGSLGYTLFPEDDADADTLLRHADVAMYAAKQSGKNRFSRFDLKLNNRQKANMGVSARMEKGLSRNEFVLYAQPKVNLNTGEIVGAEALIRWQHPIRGLVPPIEFLPLVSLNRGLALRFDQWVLDESLRLMADWLAQGLRLPLGINMSSHQFLERDFPARLNKALKDYPQLAPQDLEIEIVESAALEDVQHVADLIGQCRNLGVRFALDDFGTGYSTLTYLKQLQVNTLKIDQSFIADMEHEKGSLAIVQGVIGLADAFECDLVAEGVETWEQAEVLKKMGCSVAQGYLIARPMPAGELVEWVKGFQTTWEQLNAKR
jgi:diguanylate cyclase (GGDEF)-like protein/PAS domain S-box-containing protein